MAKTAISPTRQENFSEWYQQVIKGAGLAEHSPVRGCMIILPWGYGIWEQIRDYLDKQIRRTGHENVYFPQFIPLSFLEQESAHVDGFAKECAVVTHHRLEAEDGKLKPAGELEEPLVVRPTSETVVGHAFARWIQSHRDLPVKINQWANVVRWEMRTRLFLRTAEFLWQEGHTAHATPEEAEEETLKMLEVYRSLCEEQLAVPVILGKKSESEKFPGAEETYCLEAMMQDRKALQAGTSHNLGQNFSKAFKVEFSSEEGDLQNPYTTSWGMTTRLIGAMVMVHSDDDGLRVPPRVAQKHVAIIPFLMKEESKADVLAYAEKVQHLLSQTVYDGRPIESAVDSRDLRAGEKKWDWVRKGVPLRIEVGLKEMEKGVVSLTRRDGSPKEREEISLEELSARVPQLLEEVQQNLFAQASSHLQEHTKKISSYVDLLAFFTPKNADKPEIHGGFARSLWCEQASCEERLNEHKLTIRCLPLKQSGETGSCVVCGKEATREAIIAKAY